MVLGLFTWSKGFLEFSQQRCDVGSVTVPISQMRDTESLSNLPTATQLVNPGSLTPEPGS